MDIPAKHRGPIDPTPLLDSDVSHVREAWIEATSDCMDVLWLMDVCALQI